MDSAFPPPMRVLLLIAIVSLPLVVMAETDRDRIANAVFDTYDNARVKAAAAKSGARYDVDRGEVGRQVQQLERSDPATVKALRAVLADKTGWVQREGRTGSGGDGTFIQAATITGGFFFSQTAGQKWAEVSLKRPDRGSVLWGAAQHHFGGVSWRGRRWKVDSTDNDIATLPSKSSGLRVHLEGRARLLLGACAGTPCSKQARRDLRWTLETLRLVRAQGISPRPTKMGKSSDPLEWRFSVKDTRGRTRTLLIQDLAIHLGKTIKVSPLRIVGKERWTVPRRGVFSREFDRAHFDYERRVRRVRSVR